MMVNVKLLGRIETEKPHAECLKEGGGELTDVGCMSGEEF